jgi:hypothetical protein
LDPGRLSGLVDIGVDEISWKKHHHYLTLVSNHATGKIVWGKAGKGTATLDAFFGELPEGAAEELEAVSMDLGPAYAKSVRTRAPQATICFDPFHVVKLATEALEAVRRQVWQSARKLRDQSIAKKFTGARWALLKNPLDLTEDQSGTLREIKRSGGALWRAYQLKESLRAVFAGDLCYGGPLVLESAAQPNPRIRENGTHDPETPRRYQRRYRPRTIKRPPGRTEQQGTPDHPPRLRLPQSRSRAGRRHARLRTRQPEAPIPHPRHPHVEQ